MDFFRQLLGKAKDSQNVGYIAFAGFSLLSVIFWVLLSVSGNCVNTPIPPILDDASHTITNLETTLENLKPPDKEGIEADVQREINTSIDDSSPFMDKPEPSGPKPLPLKTR